MWLQQRKSDSSAGSAGESLKQVGTGSSCVRQAFRRGPCARESNRNKKDGFEPRLPSVTDL